MRPLSTQVMSRSLLFKFSSLISLIACRPHIAPFQISNALLFWRPDTRIQYTFVDHDCRHEVSADPWWLQCVSWIKVGFSSCIPGFMSTAATRSLPTLLVVHQAHDQQMMIAERGLVCGVMISSLVRFGLWSDDFELDFEVTLATTTVWIRSDHLIS